MERDIKIHFEMLFTLSSPHYLRTSLLTAAAQAVRVLHSITRHILLAAVAASVLLELVVFGKWALASCQMCLKR